MGTTAPRRTLEDDLLDLLAHHGLEAWRAMEAAEDRRYNARDAADADRRWHAAVCGRLAGMVAGL